MARFGGGKTTWIRDGESPEVAVDRFVDTINRPVLTDLEIDWGDWEVADVWPRRAPALYAGQPMQLTGRIVTEGTSPIVVRGRLGDGAFEAQVQPTVAETGAGPCPRPGRARPSPTSSGIRSGERIPTSPSGSWRCPLHYQVLSRYTAFLAVDRSRVVNPEGAPDQTVEQPGQIPDGTIQTTANQRPVPRPQPRAGRPPTGWCFLDGAGGTEEIVVTSARPAVDVEATSRGTVLTKDFLTKIPTGRSYQTAVSFAAGVPGRGRGQPEHRRGLQREHLPARRGQHHRPRHRHLLPELQLRRHPADRGPRGRG